MTVRPQRLHARAFALVAALLVGLIVALSASAAPVIPVPNPLVKVRTESGNLVRERVIPLGGAPIPLDVDEQILNGLLFPDVDVAVGLIAAEELPGKPIVPTITVNRDPIALLRNAPAPPLKIDFTIELDDAGSGLSDLADITYGYETPKDGRVPAMFKSKLIGPVEGGFVDPLEAVVETPGYSAPLKLNANVVTPTFEGDFQVGVNPIPERIHFIEDPRDDGLDFAYDHQGPIPDTKLDAAFELIDPEADRVREVTASVERLPHEIKLSNTNTNDRTFVSYEHESDLPKPDLEATYRDTDEGETVVDANVKVGGLPGNMEGEVGYAGGELDSVDFQVLEGDEIDSVDFLARNYTGADGNVPVHALGPDQFVAVATRQQLDESSRFRAAGRMLGVRAARFELQESDNETIDVTTDIGDGNRPLRAIADLDNRGPGGPPDPADRKRLKVDARVTPLPRNIHVNFDPARGADPTRVTYDSDQTVDVDTEALIADGDSTDGCGQAEVTCLEARVDKLAPHLEVSLPGEGGKDFSLAHNAGSGLRPDVRATVDRTPVNPADRTYAEVELLRVPKRVTGRLDISQKDVLRAAEFHACDWDFGATPPACVPDTEGALGRVTFTVRDQPERGDLPPRRDTVANFVSLISRDPEFETQGEERFEATGRVDEVRHVAFHQRDVNDDGEPDGTLGVSVDAGIPKQPFDAVVDTEGFFTDPDDETTSLGDTTSDIFVHVFEMPTSFDACVRQQDETAPPDPASLPADPLLAACDRTNVLGRAPGELSSTPLSVAYEASNRTKVRAQVATTKPDTDDDHTTDQPRVTELDATVDTVPAKLRTDVIPSIKPEEGVAGRKLEFAYDANDGDPSTADTVPTISFDLANRRSNSLCEDPRPVREATCVTGVLKNLPEGVNATFDPDETEGDLVIETEPPGPNQDAMSINPDPEPEPFRLSTVAPEVDATPLILEARVEDIVPRLEGEVQRLNLDGEGIPTNQIEDAKTPLADRIATCDDDDNNDNQHGADELDPDCEPDMARLRLNACPGVDPEDLPDCDGIGKIWFKATNSLVGDPLPAVPPGPGGVTQDFSFVQSGEDFRATGTINKFKEVALDRLDPQEDPSETTKLRAAFGDGDATDKVRAYVDRDTGTEAQKIDAVIAEAPQAVNLCLRGAVHPDDVETGGEFGFCEKAAEDKTAIETRLDAPAGVDKPDITVSEFRLAKGGGAEVLRGIPGSDPAIAIEDLAQKIEVLAGEANEQAGKRSDLLVEGKTLGGDLDNVAGRASFALQNFDETLGPGFPRDSLFGATDPENDPDNDDDAGAPNAGRNYVKVIKAREKLQFEGSVPAVKRIRLDPEPCDPNDPRFPPEADFDQPFRPEYTCVNALASQDRPLGFAVRTLDENGDVLALDEGGLNPVPAGAGGLLATMTKSPDTTKNSKVCATHADALEPEGCRPPFISLEAPRSQGQDPPVFRARVATGPKELVESLRDLAPETSGVQGPIDQLSSRLDYEQSPGDYAVPGARLKLGTSGEETALRGGFRLEVPEFLDLDPPTSYSCKHVQKDVLGDCKSTEVSAEANKGFEAKDIAIKLVGSNTGHGNADLDTLGPEGRLALLVHDFDKSKQTILTGAPAADGPSGTTTHTPERGETSGPRPPAGAYDNGMVIPGYVDARVYMRDDYNPTGDDETQQKFIQVDGRVNHPLTLALRLNEPDVTGRYGGNRDGDTVPTTQFTVRNAPCAGRPACAPYANENFNDPSFRIRAEVRGPKKEGKDDRCQGVDEWGAGFGFTACIILPQPDARWMNVDLNHQPTSADPARTVEAVAATFDNNFDLKAFRNVNDKGTPAKFTPQAALRLDPFEIGFKAGVGIGIVGASTEMFMNADLILGAAGLANEQLLISNEAGAVRLKSSGGESQINTDLKGFFRTIVTAEALFGLISDSETHTTQTGHIHLEFLECPGVPSFIASHDGMSVTNDNTKAAIQLIPGPNQAASPAAAVITGINALILPIFCLLDTQEDDLVTGSYPAPRWSEPGRPIEDVGEQNAAGGGGDGGFNEQPPEKRDITISGTQTMCGTVAAKTLRVTSTGTLRVGTEGDTVPGPPPTTTNITCDGRLFLEVDNLIVEAGGVIDASAKRTTAGPGQPGSGAGGGAGHAGAGGPSGSGGPGGGTYGNNSNLTDAFGSRGRDGSAGAAGGPGGGVLRVDAAEQVTVNGLVAARGGGGAAVAGGDCNLTSAGGGSGGAIRLVANKVSVGGTVSATGGAGGSGSNGGGGGGGGRVRIDSVIQSGAGGTFAGGGSAGGAGGSCNAGTAGNAGSVVENELGLAAGVTRANTDPWVQGSVQLDLTGVKEGGGDLDIVVCRATVPLGTPEPFDNPGIEPPSVSDTEDLDVPSRCQTEEFAGPTSGGDTYERTITINGLADAYYGFYAFAKDDNVFFDDYQPIPPTRSTVKLGSDSTAPVITDLTRRNGVAGCESDSFCLDATTGLMRLAANDGNGSGIAEGLCKVNTGAFNINCLPAESVSVELGGDGLRTVDVRLTDVAGNTTLASASGKEAKWFVDLKAPDPPGMVLQQQGGQENGWYKTKPTLTVQAEDPAPSAGFDANAITVLVDEAERSCPGDPPPAGPSVACSTSDTQDFVPDNGIHSFRAYVTDRLGHRSNPLRTKCEGSVDPDACTMQVDSKEPTSRLFIGPKNPDGSNGWYKTRPFFAFAASDGPGGSGIDLAKEPSKIQYSIDGKPFETWNPTADEVNRIPEGIHTICWFATDVAGNKEDSGSPNPNPSPGNPANCRSGIKVDTTAPVAEAPISPADPNGNNSFYTVKPDVDPQGSDQVPPNVPAGDISGLDKVQYQVDMGDWTAAAPFNVQEGEHEVRVRAFDRAGNAAQIVQRNVRVDVSKPTARIASYPPRPNEQGWFRQNRIDSIAASDGRDSSGEDGATYSIDGASPISYLGPFAIEHGLHDVTVRARDRAGLLSDRFDQHSKVDTLAPVPRPVGPAPQPVLLPGNTTTLRFDVDGTLGPRVKVIVWVYNELGIPVHSIQAPGPHPGGFRDSGPGQVVWNGRDGRDRGNLPGLYHYRVQAIDQAGNSAISTESPFFLVLLPGLPA